MQLSQQQLLGKKAKQIMCHLGFVVVYITVISSVCAYCYNHVCFGVIMRSEISMGVLSPSFKISAHDSIKSA